MFSSHIYLRKFQKIIFSHKRNFSTPSDYHFLNSYLKESLHELSKSHLKANQMNIIESINKTDLHSMILCDDFSGRKYSSLLGVMNRVINSKEKSTEQNLIHKHPASEIKEDEYFTNTKQILKKSKENSEQNLKIKKEIKPRGALVICQKYEFATHFYRICRKFDFQNRLRLVRVGTSLHSVTPTIDLDTKYSDTDDQEEKEKEEIQLGNINLINTTEWKNIDILFITPEMLDYVSSKKDSHDYFDINPEIILVDDFDYIFKSMSQISSNKYDIRKHLAKFFSKESKFYSDITKNRKLVLSSSTIQSNIQSLKNNYEDEIKKSLEEYKSYLGEINNEFINKLDVVTSQNFMNLDFYTKGVKMNIKQFEGDTKSNFEKKLKYLTSLVNSSNFNSQFIICCNDQNISLIKENFKKKKLNFVSVDENDRIGQRLFSVMLYNKYQYNILLITPIFLKSLNIVKLSTIILFDYPSEFRDVLRILSKFPKKEDEENKNICHLLLEPNEMEKFSYIIERI